jgi:hypothetical protein
VELYLYNLFRKREFRKIKSELELWVLGVSGKVKIKYRSWEGKLVGKSWWLGRVKIG